MDKVHDQMSVLHVDPRRDSVRDESAHPPALLDLEFLLGKWDVEPSDAPFLPSLDDRAHGQVAFAWIVDTTLLVMRQSEQPGAPPSARWAIGRDSESGSDFKVLYSDTRGVVRISEMSFTEGIWRLWRDHPGISQRFESRVSPDRNKIFGHWEKSSHGDAWEHDFELIYRKIA